MANVGNKWSC